MKHTAKRFAALLAALVLALCLSIPAFAAAPLVRDEMGPFFIVFGDERHTQ